MIDGTENTQGWNRFSYVKGNPIQYKDPTGHFVDDLLAFGLGAAAGVASKYAVDKAMDNPSDNWDYAIAGLAGGIQGEVLYRTGNPIFAGGLSGGIASGLTEFKNYKLNKNNKNGQEIAAQILFDTSLGAVFGMVPSPALQGITRGRGSWSQVMNQMMTKYKNGTADILNTKLKTFGKMLGAKLTQEVPGSTVQGGLSAEFDESLKSGKRKIVLPPLKSKTSNTQSSKRGGTPKVEILRMYNVSPIPKKISK